MCQGTDSIYRFIDLSESFLKDGRYIDKSLFRHGFIIFYSEVRFSNGYFARIPYDGHRKDAPHFTRRIKPKKDIVKVIGTIVSIWETMEIFYYKIWLVDWSIIYPI